MDKTYDFGFIPKKRVDNSGESGIIKTIEIAKKRNPDIKISEHFSKYGKSNDYEAFAEMFMNSQCGEPNELGKAMNIFLERSGYV